SFADPVGGDLFVPNTQHLAPHESLPSSPSSGAESPESSPISSPQQFDSSCSDYSSPVSSPPQYFVNNSNSTAPMTDATAFLFPQQNTFVQLSQPVFPSSPPMCVPPFAFAPPSSEASSLPIPP